MQIKQSLDIISEGEVGIVLAHCEQRQNGPTQKIKISHLRCMVDWGVFFYISSLENSLKEQKIIWGRYFFKFSATRLSLNESNRRAKFERNPQSLQNEWMKCWGNGGILLRIQSHSGPYSIPNRSLILRFRKFLLCITPNLLISTVLFFKQDGQTSSFVSREVIF